MPRSQPSARPANTLSPGGPALPNTAATGAPPATPAGFDRRQLLSGAGGSLACWALSALSGGAAGLTGANRAAGADGVFAGGAGGLAGLPHRHPTAKRVIWLFQSGAPSQLDLFDYKPGLADRRATELPDSIRQGQRLTGMTATQASFPVAPTRYAFARHGASGMELSELLPHTARIADQLCVIKTLHTEAINHDPAVTFFQTGAQLAGRPSL
ncbi:MAG: DUF1501 domain-containing protein, partial [Planctomycetaceae bacterium]